MRLSGVPDFSSSRRLAGAALAVALVVSIALIFLYWRTGARLADGDDAMRLVLVRDLLSGRGWFDQWLGRLQPPLGSFMHWSRLLDGAIAGAIGLMRVFLPPARAEAAVLVLWPLAWLVPALVCAFVLSRRLGGDAAVLACAILFLIDLQAYEQFRPGRIDHHSVQIVMALIATACFAARANRARWAILAGMAAGLGLAIGLEAVLFQALVGGAYGIGWALDSSGGKAARRYGLAFAATLGLCFLLQTPPGRWTLAFCDSLGVNLLAGGVAAGLGLFAVTILCERWPVSGRFAALALVGLAAVGICLALDPQCVRGPFAAADPRLHPVWLDGNLEIRSWVRLWRTLPDTAVFTIAAGILVAAAALIRIARELPRPPADILLICVLALVAVVMASDAFRMQDYVFWLGLPVLAAECSALAGSRPRLVFVVALGFLCSPIMVGSAADRAMHLWVVPSKPPAPSPALQMRCTDPEAYQRLSALPPGLVAADIDLGPFILLNTRDSVLAAPYHRMDWGILSAHDALTARQSEAEGQLRRLRVRYVLDCRDSPVKGGAGSLASDLRHGHTPAWLQALSTPDQVIGVYGLRR